MKLRTHVFAVAVEYYQNPEIPRVSYAENDAARFVEAWQELGVAPSDCVMLLSSKATLAAAKSQLKLLLQRVRPGERVILFYAGHGAAFNDTGYVTVHDTQLGDLQATSIPLAEILEQIRNSKSGQVALFIDPCHHGFPISPGVQSIDANFSADELNAFCADAKSHVAFASCQTSELSRSSVSLQHGLWSYCVIQALKGEAKDALEQGRLITSQSLQAYLQTEVPRLLKVTITGLDTQTPSLFGNCTQEFVVADVKDILQQRLATNATPVNFVKDASLVKEVHGNVKGLSGYTKPLRPLSSHSSWEQSFVESAGESEVKDRATTIYEAARASLGYKRKDIMFNIDKGFASIKTPDFDVNVTLAQDTEDAEQYVFSTEVVAFRRPSIVQDPQFLSIFSSYCDTIVIELETPLDLEAKIDEIEEIPAIASGLKYDPDCTQFTLRLAGTGILLRATTDRLTFSLPSGGDLGNLIAQTQAAFSQLGGSSITLGLPGGTS